MTTISGIPAHALLVHAIVVLAPLTALLEILCAFWPAARRRLVWLVLAFAVVNHGAHPAHHLGGRLAVPPVGAMTARSCTPTQSVASG